LPYAIDNKVFSREAPRANFFAKIHVNSRLKRPINDSGVEDNMRRVLSIFAGLALVGLGGLALAATLFFPRLEWQVWHLGIENTWQLWPVTVIGVGVAFALVPLMVWRRWAGMFFIPAMPILTTGGILLLASLSHWWSVWHWAWPLEVLAVAAGFLFAAIYARLVWLVIPAIFVGLNGLVLQFCVVTGLWESWAVLWPVEFLAVGLTLLIVGFKARSGVVLVVGMMFCGLSGAAMAGMLALVTGLWHLAGLLGAGGLIFLGVVLLAWSLFGARRPPAPTAASAA
jgi:hypothetical protein